MIISDQGSGSGMKVKNRISSIDLFFVMIQTMIGVGLLSLPHDTYQTAESDGWISLLISGVIIQLIILLLWLLCRKFPNLTLFDFSKMIVGKVPGTIINVLYIIHFLAVVCYIFIVFIDFVKRWILPETPAWVLIFIGVILLIYGSACTVKNVVHLFSFSFIFILLLFFIFQFAYLDPTFDVRYLLPIGSSGGLTILQGTRDTLSTFVGFEVFLIYFAFTKHSKQRAALWSTIFAVLFVTILSMSIVIVSTMMLSPEEMKVTLTPVLYLLSAIDVHVLNRLDLIFLSIWGPVVLMTIIGYSFAAGMGISKVFRLNHNISVSLFGMCLFIISTIFYYKEITIHDIWIELFILIFGIGIPLIFFLLTVFFKKGAVTPDENS